MKCPRCITGCLTYEQLEFHGRYHAYCINCAWRYAKPLVEDVSKGTPYLPVVTEIRK